MKTIVNVFEKTAKDVITEEVGQLPEYVFNIRNASDAAKLLSNITWALPEEVQDASNKLLKYVAAIEKDDITDYNQADFQLSMVNLLKQIETASASASAASVPSDKIDAILAKIKRNMSARGVDVSEVDAEMKEVDDFLKKQILRPTPGIKNYQHNVSSDKAFMQTYKNLVLDMQAPYDVKRWLLYYFRELPIYNKEVTGGGFAKSMKDRAISIILTLTFTVFIMIALSKIMEGTILLAFGLLIFVVATFLYSRRAKITVSGGNSQFAILLIIIILIIFHFYIDGARQLSKLCYLRETTWW